MERLTKKGISRYVCNAELEYCQKNKTNDVLYCCSCDRRKQMQNKLGEYEDLEEQGLLLKLPCKVGDTVYVLWSGYDFVLGKEEREVVEEAFQIEMTVYLGKTVFLTKEEAEKKLADMTE